MFPFYLNFSISIAISLMHSYIHFTWFPCLHSLLHFMLYSAVICLFDFTVLLFYFCCQVVFLCTGPYDYWSGQASSPALLLHTCVPSYSVLYSFWKMPTYFIVSYPPSTVVLVIACLSEKPNMDDIIFIDSPLPLPWGGYLLLAPKHLMYTSADICVMWLCMSVSSISLNTNLLFSSLYS